LNKQWQQRAIIIRIISVLPNWIPRYEFSASSSKTELKATLLRANASAPEEDPSVRHDASSG